MRIQETNGHFGEPHGKRNDIAARFNLQFKAGEKKLRARIGGGV